MHILLVDDDKSLRKLLSNKLESNGFTVIEASDGVDALEILRREPIDAVVSDILMPSMDGYQLCYEIRNSPSYSTLPVILCSAIYTLSDDAKLALEAGADLFLRKPISEKELIDAIQRLVAEKNRRSPGTSVGAESLVLKEYSARLVERLEATNVELRKRTEELAMSEEKFRVLTQELRESQEYLRAIINTEPECVKLVSKDGTVIQMNPAGLAMIEAESEAQIRGKSVYSVIAPEHRGAFRRLSEEVFQGKQGMLEFEVIGLKGTCRWMETHAVPLLTDGQTITAMLSLTRDITDRKAAAHQLGQTKRYLESILENSLDLIFTVKKDGTFGYFNPRLETILGYTKEELAARHFLEFIPLSRHPFMMEKWKEINQGISGTYETEVIRADGVLVNCLVSHSPVPGFEEFLVVLKDVTELKKAERELKDANEKIESFFNSTGDSIAFFDLEGNVLRVNKAFETIYGWSQEEVVGMNLPMIPEDLMEDAQRILNEVKAGNKIIGYDTKRLRKDGSEFEASVTISPIHDIAGNVVMLGAVSRDVTERKRAEEQRRVLESQLIQAQKMESIGTLAAGIAHNFNNILGIMLGHLNLLENNRHHPANFAKSIEMMGQAIERGTKLVQQLLTFVRKTETSVEPVQLNDLVSDLVNLLRGTFPTTIEIQTALDDGLPLAMADANQVHQVLLNLCLNARDAMPQGGTLLIETKRMIGDTLRTRFQTAYTREYVLINVADTGTGMDEATRNRIFDPFFTTKEKGKGSGLGLSTVYGIVQSQRGFIEVESEPGKGTTFRVYFPAQHSSESIEYLRE